ncbi:GntR family transcriptional regulator [Nonomuraea basaltis]|uniref:GntR family transcriptional regulator n=1 Tax=Nonomuraea basaltis TaxID=2495887 RepID=UPI00110C4207|nr:GntR family transcriptional regulator [Nonomuraea basaltis]TMR97514.1 GntR family transcriptional regulator [Nonomuraea basaltis]
MAAIRYREIADQLRDAISDGTYRPGDLLPQQDELMRTHHASKGTINTAIRELRYEGLISRAAQRGRLVVLDNRPVLIDLSLTASTGGGLGPWETACKRAGMDGRMTVTAAATVESDPDIAQALQIRTGQPVIRRDRRALLGGQSVMLDTAFYPASLVESTPLAGEGSVSGGVYAALIDAGLLDPATATTTDMIRSRAATAREAERLKVRPGSPVLDIERITRDGEGRPVELLRRVANGARVRVVHDARTITV